MNNFRKSPLWRKSTALLKQLPRLEKRLRCKPQDFVMQPPVLCNSFPKSGTHLLLQVLDAVPGLTNYGTFFASMPTLTFREVDSKRMTRRLYHLIPGELAAAHLFYHDTCRTTLARRSVLHFFIYRDPRDVVVSEAYYLTNMNRYHPMHCYFKNLQNPAERIMLAIKGMNRSGFTYDYPDIRTRFAKYSAWLAHEDVFSVRFEDIVGQNRPMTISYILRFIKEKIGFKNTQQVSVDQLITAIDPNKSHTYRKGEVKSWQKHFTREHRNVFKGVAGDLLLELGYEKDHNW